MQKGRQTYDRKEGVSCTFILRNQFIWSCQVIIQIFVLRYCQENGPDPVTLKGKAAKKGLKVLFMSDKKIQASGAQCTAECLDGAAATTTEAPTTTSG